MGANEVSSILRQCYHIFVYLRGFWLLHFSCLSFFLNHLISAQLKTPPQYLVKLNIYIVQENIIPFLKSKICCFCQFLWSGISFILCYPPNHFIAKSTDPLMAFQETDSTNNNHVKYTMFTNC